MTESPKLFNARTIPKHLASLPIQKVDTDTWRLPHGGEAYPSLWLTKQYEGYVVHWHEPADTKAAMAFRKDWNEFGGRALSAMTGREVMAGQTSIVIKHPRNVREFICCVRRLTLIAAGFRDRETESAWQEISQRLVDDVFRCFDHSIQPFYGNVELEPQLRREIMAIVTRGILERFTNASPLACHLTIAERLQVIHRSGEYVWSQEIKPQAR
jgi:hypothetical protein